MLANGRVFMKQVDSAAKVLSLRQSTRHCNVSPSEKAVHIPQRIERGPTDILKALASTVQMDPTAYHYTIPDDPYFYTTSDNVKKINALAFESGRKSAKWVIDQNPKFFSHQLSEPPIKAFLEGAVEDSESEPTEKKLMHFIEKRNVSEAIELYKSLLSKNIEVSKFTTQSLFELVCFYNCNQPPKKSPEEIFFEKKDDSKREPMNQWSTNNFAHELFNLMDQSCPLAVSTLILGMIKHRKFTLAYESFVAALEKRIKLSVDVFNGLLKEARYISKQSNIITFQKKIFQEMAEQKVKPNLATLNAALNSLLYEKKENVLLAQQLFAEFSSLGIRPSLGSFGYLFTMAANDQPSKHLPLIRKWMSQIKDQKHEILHPSDFLFFEETMKLFSSFYADFDLSFELFNMLLKNNNSKFLVTAEAKKSFFNNFFIILFKNHPVDSAMEMYRRHVHGKFGPRKSLLKVITEAIVSGASNENKSKYLADIWNDLKALQKELDEPMAFKILAALVHVSDETALKVSHEIVLHLLEKIKTNAFFVEDMLLLSDVLIVLVKNQDVKNCEAFMDILKQHFSKQFLKNNAIKLAFEFAISKKNSKLILIFLEFAAASNKFDMKELVEVALPFLNEEQKQYLSTTLKSMKKKKVF